MASVNPESGTTLERLLNRSLVSTVLPSKLIAIGLASYGMRKHDF